MCYGFVYQLHDPIKELNMFIVPGPLSLAFIKTFNELTTASIVSEPTMLRASPEGEVFGDVLGVLQIGWDIGVVDFSPEAFAQVMRGPHAVP